MSDITANCVFCEQIREEASGKLMFIGVISGDLLMEEPEEERVLLLTQFIQIRGLEPGSYDFELRIEKFHQEHGTLSAALPGHFVMSPDDLEASIVAEGLKVNVTHECTIKAILKIGDHRPMEIGAFQIEFYRQDDRSEDL